MTDIEALRSALVMDLQAQNERLRDRLAKREFELLQLRGRCRNSKCNLHRDHAGECDEED